MRKQKRQMKTEDAWRCFDEAPYATLGLATPDADPYLVALSMARINETIYFHCAMAGQKWDMLQANTKVCISAISLATVKEEALSVNYESCTIQGNASIVENSEEKLQALYAICEKFCPTQKERFASYLTGSVEHTGIVKVMVTSISGKHNPI